MKNLRKTKLSSFIFIILLFTLIFCSACQKNSGEYLSSKNNENKPKNAVSYTTVGCTGDVLLHNPVLRSCYNSAVNTYDFTDMFSFLSPYIKNLDCGVVNLECSISSPQWGYSGYPQFKAPESIVDALKNTGFNLLLTANNHANDGGSKGVFRTLEVLKQKDTAFIGIKNDKQSLPYTVRDCNGIKIGMVNYTYGQWLSENKASLNGIPMDVRSSELTNVFDYNNLDLFYSQMEKTIQNMKNDGAEATVLFIHWGTEYQLKPNDYQKKIAQKMCDLGIDVIFGGHPHVVQPVEVLKSENQTHKTVCIYSVGNLVSNQRVSQMNLKTGHTEDGLLFTATFKKDTDGKVKVDDVNFLPTWVQLKKSNGKNQYKIIPLDKSIDWSKKFDLGSDLENARKSYDRTLALVEKGVSEFKSNK